MLKSVISGKPPRISSLLIVSYLFLTYAQTHSTKNKNLPQNFFKRQLATSLENSKVEYPTLDQKTGQIVSKVIQVQTAQAPQNSLRSSTNSDSDQPSNSEGMSYVDLKIADSVLRTIVKMIDNDSLKIPCSQSQDGNPILSSDLSLQSVPTTESIERLLVHAVNHVAPNNTINYIQNIGEKPIIDITSKRLLAKKMNSDEDGIDSISEMHQLGISIDNGILDVKSVGIVMELAQKLIQAQGQDAQL